MWLHLLYKCSVEGWGRRGSNNLAFHSLSGNSIGPAGGVPLAKSLTHCRCLEEIM